PLTKRYAPRHAVKIMKTNTALLLLLIFISLPLHAKPITLENEKEIHRANQLSLAMDAVSEKVMACTKKATSPKESCTCPDMDSCQFRAEFNKATSLYCSLKSDFPKWINKPIIYSIKGSKITHALSMEAL